MGSFSIAYFRAFPRTHLSFIVVVLRNPNLDACFRPRMDKRREENLLSIRRIHGHPISGILHLLQIACPRACVSLPRQEQESLPKAHRQLGLSMDVKLTVLTRAPRESRCIDTRLAVARAMWLEVACRCIVLKHCRLTPQHSQHVCIAGKNTHYIDVGRSSQVL